MVLLKYNLMVQTNRKLEKRGYHKNIIIVLVKGNEKLLVAFTKMQLNGQEKKESRKSGCH